MKRTGISANRKSEPAGPAQPDIDRLLGAPPLFKGEDRKAYHALQDQVRNLVKPVDLIEQFWIRDVVDLIWEIGRLRRLKAKLMSASAHKGLHEILKPITGYDADDLVEGWAAGDRTVVKKVNGLLAKAQIDTEAIMAQTLLVEIDPIERIERMIAGAESRLSAVLREIDRRRDQVAARLRHAVAAIEDAEFQEVSDRVNGRTS
ncbi:hypothetical protein [Pseudorhodoplanes sp.]|uniref:hypothetical protein n=1 Tax=Pseudorhodoplanes sp. TaxID=1934341 RepID=UPI00391A130F